MGKTYSVHKKLIEDSIDYIEIDGHEGVEAIDLLGYYTKDTTGNLVWLDGVLSQAFREAQTKKICLFIDEMLRIPSRELNILVGALTPMSDKTFTLRTNRIVDSTDGIGKTEYIKIPMENLWCVSTTNVGAGYEVDEIDSALSDRFRTMVKTTSEPELEAIINSQLSDKSFNIDYCTNLLEFYKQMRDLAEAGELEKFINTRHICEAIQFSNNVSEIKEYLIDLIPSWVTQETNGSLSKSEIDLVQKLIKRTL